MESLVKSPSTISTISAPPIHPRNLKMVKSLNAGHIPVSFPRIYVDTSVSCTKLTQSQWETSPIIYANDDSGDFLKKTSNIFDTPNVGGTVEVPVTNNDELAPPKTELMMQFLFLKWPMWLLGPALLLATGMAPTLWLPLSAVFLGPNIASLLSLIGLDCIFNLGATLFLLMADSCSRPKEQAETLNSNPPFSYKFWNMVATVSGLVLPSVVLIASQKGVVQPQLPTISFAVLLGPYLLLLSVQILTEMLTWHWQSPVWLVTPVVYEAYRVLQLMRGLKLGAELNAPAWMLHMIRGLVSWWILILGVQLMSVAWFAGFAARARREQQSSESAAAA